MLFANVCAGFISSCYGECCYWRLGCSFPVMGDFGFCFGILFFFFVSSLCLVHMGSSSFAGLPVVYKAWVTSVCLLLDTPFGRRSVGALPL